MHYPVPGEERSSVQRLSVYADSQEEIDAFKWISSQKAGYDLGDSAIKQWVREHWRGYLRARWLEHLQGQRYWIELDRGDFGLLRREFPADGPLLTTILEKLKVGQENLDILCWARNEAVCTDSVVNILESLDINSRRLLHKFDDTSSHSA
jgi:hypothetical protein